MTDSKQPSPDMAAASDAIGAALRAHRIKLRVLSSVAFLFGVLAIAASIALVWCYFIFYLPRQKQMLEDAAYLPPPVQTNALPTPQDGHLAKRLPGFTQVHIIMTHLVSVGVTVIAVAVAVLGLGTVVTLTVVLVNRRATLQQINVSLAQISEQLRHLHTGPAPPGASGT